MVSELDIRPNTEVFETPVRGYSSWSSLERNAASLSRYALIDEILDRVTVPPTSGPYQSAEFERVSPIGDKDRKKLVRLMLDLPDNRGHDLFVTSASLRHISDNASNHRALERMYTGPVDGSEPTTRDLLWSRLFIENIHNAMAVRNRLRIVRSVFTDHMRGCIAEGKTDVDVLSIAAGSSRGMIESLVHLNGEGHDRISLRLVDLMRDALGDARKLINEFGIEESVELIRAHYRQFARYIDEGYHPEFVEIVGLLDYVPDEDVVNLLSHIRTSLPEGGTILYSNIVPNDEQEFTGRIVGWPPMVYRRKGALVKLARESGFKDKNIIAIKEPLGIYNLVVAQK